MIAETEKTDQPGIDDTEGATPQSKARRRPRGRVAGAILLVCDRPRCRLVLLRPWL